MQSFQSGEHTSIAESDGFSCKVPHRNDQLLCLFIIPWPLQTGEQYVCVYTQIYVSVKNDVNRIDMNWYNNYCTYLSKLFMWQVLSLS